MKESSSFLWKVPLSIWPWPDASCKPLLKVIGFFNTKESVIGVPHIFAINVSMHCFDDLIDVQIRTEKGIYILTELITGGQLYEQMRDTRGGGKMSFHCAPLTNSCMTSTFSQCVNRGLSSLTGQDGRCEPAPCTVPGLQCVCIWYWFPCVGSDRACVPIVDVTARESCS